MVILLFVLATPPMRSLLESIMVTHMHMQMMLLFGVGILIAPLFQYRLNIGLDTWNASGYPGMVLCLLIISYWMLPRTMDESLELWWVELFKFISLPFLAGMMFRDSWPKLNMLSQMMVMIFCTILFGILGYLYIFAETNLCNNYVTSDQLAVGWAFMFLTVTLILYMLLVLFTDQSQYYES